MIPAGYLAKRVAPRPSWLEAPHVADIYSVSNCISDDFADYINFWKHNGYWFFDSPQIIRAVASDHAIDLTATTLFFYEVHELEFDDEGRRWTTFTPEPTFTTDVVPPADKRLEGYDVVSFSARTSPECSPLSCSGLAASVAANQHCLLDSSERAQELLESGAFNNTEPGPFRIFAVYSTLWAD